ncbi:CcdC protein domain-containing protein [Kitasatospora phosalacinea]|uniref:CcdC protein domain-containing protein n=1 Tax=Kitasatospora phosalacinea TaxID=2065 RepID=UPI0005277074|nr:CcdC protein domain-containing protein [Kitasatospora phosalacinea]
MTALSDVLIAVAVIVLVLGRQLRARRLDTERRFWLIPLVLAAAAALRDPVLLDPHHRAAAAVLVAGSMLTTAGMGCVWGWTVRIWRETDGSVWSKGTTATAFAWVGALLLRAAWYGVGGALHVHQSGSVLLLSLGLLLLVRSAAVQWRARRLGGELHALAA